MDYSQIKINKKEVLRYLQYNNQQIEENLNLIVDNSIELTKEIINPKVVYKKCKIDSHNKNMIYLPQEDIVFESSDIYKLLENCQDCILICATLGLEIEREIRKFTYTNLTKGVILDACATTAIEEVCDMLQDKIEENLNKQGKYITMRYSPGYGDLSIEKNKDIVRVLNGHHTIGLTVNENGIMIPRKSVVAIIGISNKLINITKKSCDSCSNSSTCKYKKGDDYCGN